MPIIAGQHDPAEVRGQAERPCRNVDPEIFFGPNDSPEAGPMLRWELDAVTVCEGCPVRAACLDAALEFPAAEQHGVIGGTTAGQRRRLLRRERREPTRSYVTAMARVPAPARGALPGGVDGRVVMALASGELVAEASRLEAAHAALLLHRCGYETPAIAAQLGEHDRQIQRWLDRHRAGEPLVQRSGPRSGSAAA